MTFEEYAIVSSIDMRIAFRGAEFVDHMTHNDVCMLYYVILVVCVIAFRFTRPSPLVELRLRMPRLPTAVVQSRTQGH